MAIGGPDTPPRLLNLMSKTCSLLFFTPPSDKGSTILDICSRLQGELAHGLISAQALTKKLNSTRKLETKENRLSRLGCSQHGSLSHCPRSIGLGSRHCSVRYEMHSFPRKDNIIGVNRKVGVLFPNSLRFFLFLWCQLNSSRCSSLAQL
jgi:hypothetical protein